MKWNRQGQFENPPSGSHLARCYSLIDLGTQKHSFGGDTWECRDVRISFELPLTKMTGKYNAEAKGKPFSVNTTVRQSMHSNSRLRKLLEGWRGRKFTKEEIDKFDPKKMLGAVCRLQLIENGEYVNIDSISPLDKSDQNKMPKKAINKLVYFSLEEEEYDQKVFDSLNEATRTKILKSRECSEDDNRGEEAQADPGEEEDQRGHVDEPF